ncbi:MAG: aldose epimerase family protein [Candidatus Marinimicrobia bacterium]|nr:aldose epimerase family protein [Candidatus Neomarinimicrobiota bacterium]
MSKHNKTSISEFPFGQLSDGTQITEYRLENKNKISISVLNYGGIIHSIVVPDINGEFADILLGYEDIDGYLQDRSYMGAILGRYANRIADSSIILDGVKHLLPSNDGTSCNHGGTQGFNQVVWDSEIIYSEDDVALVLNHLSPDGDQGFPGNLEISIRYTLNQKNELTVQINAYSDQKTVVNISLHPYFNLTGLSSVNIETHMLEIKADEYLPINDSMIPKGEKRTVSQSPFDFRTLASLGSRLSKQNPQLKLAEGFDHCFVIRDSSNELKEMAIIEDPVSRRRLTLSSNAPGLQLYTGNYLNGNVPGKRGAQYNKWQAVCLEPQHFPNSPSEKSFPSTVLKPGQEYNHQIRYKFDIAN